MAFSGMRVGRSRPRDGVRAWQALRMARRVAGLLVLVPALLVSVEVARAANGDPGAMPTAGVEEADATITGIEQALRARAEPDIEQLRNYLGQIPDVRGFASQCVNENQSALGSVRNQLETLGEANMDEAAGVQQQRASLQERQSRIERQLQLCRVVQLRARELENRLTSLQQERLTQRLMQRERPAWEIAAENLSQPGQWWNTAKLFLLRDSGLDTLSYLELVVLAGLILVGVGGSLHVAQAMYGLAERMRVGSTLTSGFVMALLTSAASTLPALLTSLAVAIYLTAIQWRVPGWPFITLLSYGLSAFFVFQFLVRAFLAPVPPARSYLPAPEGLLRGLAARVRSIGILILIVALVSATLVVEGFPEPVQNLLRLIFATVLIIDLSWTIWLAGGLLRWHETRGPRILLVAMMLSALVAEWTGYKNLSEYIVAGLVGTLVAFGVAWFVWRLFNDFYDGLDEGRRGWHRRVREALGVGPDRYMPGLIWLRVLTALGIWGAFGLVVLLLWGLSDTGLAVLGRVLYEGFNVGRVEVVPIRVLWGILGLIVAITVTGWLKQRLSHRWLERTRMERGAREAIVTVTGYAGVIVAILIGLSIAGVQFTNLALIAGALSVGIGFGLQTIFNNFVSGLILLLERPVKTNDWVVVGTTEGLIKKISIRSTQIQTFDHADVIVPNSELIQGQVTNWMLRDPFGRVSVPIRVAYGSDPDQVREILLELAHDHPRVIADAVLAPPPEVLLRSFGDDGYEFELRVFIRDIDYVLHVRSEIYFGIDREFRKHGIAIPYPRRDIRIDRSDDPWRHGQRSAGDRSYGQGGSPDDMGEGDGGGDGGGGNGG